MKFTGRDGVLRIYDSSDPAQYLEVIFCNMDFSGPIGRPKTEEILVLNRGTMDANAHYIEGSDESLYNSVDISFSCLLDDTVNKDKIIEALQCGNPDSAHWSETGVSSKGNTKNDGVNFNPLFVDSGKKTVNVQVLWNSGSGNDLGYAYYEVYFPTGEQSIAESDEGVTLSCKGAVYGVIERINVFGVIY